MQAQGIKPTTFLLIAAPVRHPCQGFICQRDNQLKPDKKWLDSHCPNERQEAEKRSTLLTAPSKMFHERSEKDTKYCKDRAPPQKK